MSAKPAFQRPAFVIACCLAILQAQPASAQSSPKRKPEANPVGAFFERLTSPSPAKKKPTTKPKKPTAVAGKPPVPLPKPDPSAKADAAAGKADITAAKPEAAAPKPEAEKPDTAAVTNPFVAEPAPAQRLERAPEAPGSGRTATVVLGPGATHAVQPPGAAPVVPSTPGPAAARVPVVRGDRLPAPAGTAAPPTPPPQADKALLLSAEKVRMAKDAWAPQTRAAMFAAEPSYSAAVFPMLGSRLAAVAPIELRTVAPTEPAAVTRASPGATDIPLPRPAPPEAEVKIASLPTPEPPEPEAACVNLLAAGVESTPAEALDGEGDCGAKFPVRVVAIQTDEGRVTLDPPAVMRCGMARAVAKWLKENVAPTAKAKLGSELRSIRNASSFVCRPRNGVPGAKMSEHGRANALDISAFTLANGKVLTVGSEGGEELTAFTKDVRTAACTYVHTVLGPGSDAAHAEHLHIDLAHRGRNGDARFCQ